MAHALTILVLKESPGDRTRTFFVYSGLNPHHEN